MTEMGEYQEKGVVYPCQYARSVSKFSSHYGRNSDSQSSSYSAYNLAGPPQVDAYGDFTAAMVLRTYGPWWAQMPSYAPPLGPCPNWFRSEDFIELIYSEPAIPYLVRIRETYHPGSVVRILCCNLTPTEAKHQPPEAVRWQVLWSGPPQRDLPHIVRCFAPELEEAQFPTRLLRLEFNSQHAEYYTELDCVELVGHYAKDSYPSIAMPKPYVAPSAAEVELTEKLFRQLSLESEGAQPPVLDHQLSEPQAEEYELVNGFFDYLPEEIWLKIISYLDFGSLCNATKVNRAWFRVCNDPFLFQHINLQPFWAKVNDFFLETVEPRFHFLRSLDISWTGSCNQVSPAKFARFLEVCCQRLRRFRAVCSPLVNVSTLLFLNSLGEQLKELDLRSCSLILDNRMGTQLKRLGQQYDSDDSGDDEDEDDEEDESGFDGGRTLAELVPRLTQLTRLNLYGTLIRVDDAVTLILNNPNLEHVNVGNCNLSGHAIAEALGTCPNLKSLDLWRSLDFHPESLLALANGCPNLLELDLGWLRFEVKDQKCLIELAQKCPHLTKLFLTAVRSESDAEVMALADNCKNLQQLDLLGCSRVTSDSISYLLEHCTSMKFLDISFCSNIKQEHVDAWRVRCPNLAIKKSFTS